MSGIRLTIGLRFHIRRSGQLLALKKSHHGLASVAGSAIGAGHVFAGAPGMPDKVTLRVKCARLS
jgi:hypothetical protein